MGLFEAIISFVLLFTLLAIWLVVYRIWAVSREVEDFFSLLKETGEPILTELETVTSRLERVSSIVEQRVGEAGEGLEKFTELLDSSRDRLESVVANLRQRFSSEKGGGSTLSSALTLFKLFSSFRTSTKSNQEVDEDE